MNAEKLNSWLGVLANFGVLVGIVFLALEVRQTRDAVMGATYLARASAQEEWGKWMADSDHVVQATLRYAEGEFSALSAEDQARLLSTVEAAFHRMDGIYYQYELGLLTDEYYETTFSRLMSVWVPRWKDTGFLDRGWIVPRPSFRAEIEKYSEDPLLLEDPLLRE